MDCCEFGILNEVTIQFTEQFEKCIQKENMLNCKE